MNAKRAKMLRKAGRDLSLRYDIQKKIYKNLNSQEKEVYSADIALLLNDVRNQRVIDSYKNSV